MTVYYSDIFPSFLRTSKINFARNTAHRCPVQTEFRGTPPSFTRASFSKVSHFVVSCPAGNNLRTFRRYIRLVTRLHTSSASALKVKVQTIAHAHHARIGGADLLGTVPCTDSGSNPELMARHRVYQCMTE